MVSPGPYVPTIAASVWCFWPGAFGQGAFRYSSQQAGRS